MRLSYDVTSVMHQGLTPRPTPDAATLRDMYPHRILRWYDLAEAWLNYPLGKLLDYGCGQGDFLARMADRCDGRWGVDLDDDKLAIAKETGAVVAKIDPTKPLPFSDGMFDTVVIMEVIEHVSNERVVLEELERVLAPGGTLMLTTPHKGLLTFLDPGNFKFLFPRTHRFIHRSVLRQADYYDRRFGAARKQEQGMIADFTTDQKPWHRHYRKQQIRKLVPDNLHTVHLEVYYPGLRALSWLRLSVKVLTFGRVSSLPRVFNWMSRKLSRTQSIWGDQLIAIFEKRSRQMADTTP